MAMVTLKGPWKGMDLRETDAEEGTYFLGLNVDTSQGTIMARPVMEYLNTVDRLQLPTACVFDCPPYDPVVLDVTRFGGTDLFRVSVSDADTMEYLTSVDLGFEPIDGSRIGTCSWVQAYLNDNGQSVPVAILVTASNSYVYDPRLPLGSTSQMRRLDPAIDAQRVNSVNYSYWSAIPRGPIAVVHQTRVYYAGFNGTASASLVSPVETDQSSKMEAVLASGRAAINLNPSMVYWSDESDPAGIRADHFLQVGFGETVTGMASTGEVLVIFTDRSIYVLTGYSDDTFQLVKAVDGTGCVAHQSIVVEAGVVYFAAADGIYAFGGLGAPEALKLTEGLQQLWSGWGFSMDQLPDPMRTLVQGQFGWPWAFNPALFYGIQGRVLPTRNVILWAMPIQADVGAESAFQCTLVYDLKRRGWNIWRTSEFIHDAVEVRGNEFLLGHDGGAFRFRRTALGNTGDGTVSVPMYWLSQRIMGDEDNYRQCLGVRFKLLSTGVFTSAGGGIPTVGSDAVRADLPMACIEGEEASYDMVNDAGTANGYNDRVTRTAALELHPNSGGTYFYGTGLFGTAVFAPLDWFTSWIPLNLTSRWFRVGIIDDPYTSTARSSAVNVASIALDLRNSEGPNR